MSRFILGLVLNTLLALPVFMLGAGTLSGAFWGVVAGFCIFYGFGFGGMIILAAFVAGVVIATKYHHACCAGRGEGFVGDGEVSEPARRTGRQVLANLGVAATCAAGAALSGYPVFTFAFLGALGTSLADTLSSELGQVFSDGPRMITTMKRVAPGTDGAVSLCGLIDGAVGATVLALLAVPLMNVPFSCVWIIIGASLTGDISDSVIGAILPQRVRFGNELTNISATAVGAIAGGIAGAFI